MKILFISNYRDGHNGWSEAALLYLKAMYYAGLDVVCRPVKLNNFYGHIPDEVIEMENKDLNNIDVVIQNVLPQQMMYSSKFKYNIGLYYKETFYENHIWNDHLKMMDILWVPNNTMKEHDQKLGKKIEVIPVPCNTEEFLDINPIYIPYKENYAFYWVGDLNRRKNLKCLIAAYYLGFTDIDCTSLIIKASKFGKSAREVEEEVIKLCRVVADSLRIYNSFEDYPKIIVIGEDLTREQMLGLHKACDCFVYPSFGEAWGLPMMDALASGNMLVSSDTGGAKMMQSEKTFIVNGQLKTIQGMNSFPGLYTGRESWIDTDPSDLLHFMKLAKNQSYENKVPPKKLIKALSIQNIGEKIKEKLYALK